MSDQEKNLTNNTPEASAKNKEAVSVKKKKPGLFSRIGKWFKDLRSEAKKVTWPTLKQVVNNTVVVIITVLSIGVVIWIFDFLLGQGTKLLRGLFM